MSTIQDIFAPLLTLGGWPSLAIAALAAFLGATVRGFSGFGTAMIFVPIASVVYEPVLAVPALHLIDVPAVAPMVPAALKRCDWREVALLTAGSVFGVPLGVYGLLVIDPQVLLLAISTLILLLVAVLASGWRVASTPGPRSTVAIGMASGVLDGAAALSGPPVVLFFLAGRGSAVRMRATLLAFFAFAGFFSIITLMVSGALGTHVLLLAAVLAPFYAFGIWFGSQLFGLASEQVFRRIAFTLVTAAAILGLL